MRSHVFLLIFLIFFVVITILIPREESDAVRNHKKRTLLHSLRHTLSRKNINASFLSAASVARVKHLTPRQLNRHLSRSIPVIVTGAAPCTLHHWDLAYIEARAGHDTVSVETSRNNTVYSNDGLTKIDLTVSEFLRRFRDPQRDRDYYLAEASMDQVPSLRDDVVEPLFSSSRNLDRLQLWVGAGGQVSPLHYDPWDNVLCQISGTRVLRIFDPLQLDRLYPKENDRDFSQVDPEDPESFKRFPLFAKARSYVVELHPGEILVLPAMWWHAARHKKDVHIAVNFWYHSHTFSELLYDVALPPGHFLDGL